MLGTDLNQVTLELKMIKIKIRKNKGEREYYEFVDCRSYYKIIYGKDAF